MAVITINKDRNVSVADYRAHAQAGNLLVTGIFRTIQGEGPFAGNACVFVRLAGCNIGEKVDCPWCDTFFAYDAGTVLTPTAVLEAVRERLDGARLVVVTGGEPLLQWSALYPLLRDCEDLAWQFETNGLLLKDDIVRQASELEDVHFVVSPKIPANHGHYRMPPAAWLSIRRPRLCLKYVVDADPYSPYHEPGPTRGLPAYVSGMTVYRRPVGQGEIANVWDPTLVDQAATVRNYRHAANIVLGEPNRYRLSLQTHLFAVLE